NHRVRRVPAADEKRLHWVGSAKRDFLRFPATVKDDMGNALGIAQFGGTAPTAKPWKGLGPSVLEIVESHDGNAYRAVYTVRFEKALYVPPCLSEEVAVRHPDRQARRGSGRAETETSAARLRGSLWQNEALNRPRLPAGRRTCSRISDIRTPPSARRSCGWRTRRIRWVSTAALPKRMRRRSWA